jgi:hypothetical protein
MDSGAVLLETRSGNSKYVGKRSAILHKEGEYK